MPCNSRQHAEEEEEMGGGADEEASGVFLGGLLWEEEWRRACL